MVDEILEGDQTPFVTCDPWMKTVPHVKQEQAEDTKEASRQQTCLVVL